MRNDEELERPCRLAWPESVRARPRSRSIAKRLFFSAALLSFVILLVAGLVLSTIYRRTAEANFDERLGHALVADIATPGEDSRAAPGQLGEPQFELALSGWYWQITRLDVPKTEIRSSRLDDEQPHASIPLCKSNRSVEREAGTPPFFLNTENSMFILRTNDQSRLGIDENVNDAAVAAQ
jgi:hypothetical protein